MRSALRGTTVGTVALGLLVSSVALGLPAGAAPATSTESKATTLRLAVTTTPYVGSACVVSARLTTSEGQVGNATVAVQYRLKGTKAWTTVSNKTTKKSSAVKVERKATRAIQFRGVFLGTPGLKSDLSNTVTCTPKALRYGVKAPGVKTIQKKLKSLLIRPASTTGRFDANTLQAVYAYQKSRILPRTGTVTGATYDKILATKKMTPSSWCKDADKMCIDISKQAGYLKIKGKTYTIPVSSGGGYYYMQEGVRNFAKTPTGTFKVYYKVPGATTGPLGTYYYISFFTGGYGVHGSASVPTYAASHGCVREPRSIEKWVYKNLPIGAQVHLHK